MPDLRFQLLLSEKLHKTLSEIQQLPSSELTLYRAFEEIKIDKLKENDQQKKQIQTQLTLKNLDRMAKKNG